MIAPARLGRLVVRLVALAVIVIAANVALTWMLRELGQSATEGGARLMFTGVLVLALLAYALLMALPFVPGIEIGTSLLMVQGPVIAPFVFLATFSGLTLAYLFGRHLSERILYGIFADLGLRGACRLIDQLRPLDEAARLELIARRLPRALAAPMVRFRYLSVAVALNIPGNAVIGGGGGIAMIAGLSRTFRTGAILVTFALAVAPVPVLVLALGRDAIGWWN